MGISLTLQVWRRTAVTAVAVVTICGWPSASGWVMVSSQCWVERLVRTGLASISKVPGPTAAA